MIDPDLNSEAIQRATSALIDGMWLAGARSDVAMVAYVVLKAAELPLFEQWQEDMAKRIEAIPDVWTEEASPEKNYAYRLATDVAAEVVRKADA